MLLRRSDACLKLLLANLRAGRIVVMASDTIYGFVGKAPDTVSQLHRIKARKLRKPLLQLIPSVRTLEKLGAILPNSDILNLWPGPFTFIFKLGAGETASFRVPEDKYTQRLISKLGFNLYSTSVNRSGEAPMNDPTEIERVFGNFVSLVEDSGVFTARRPSTVVDVTARLPRILRQGAGIVPDKYLKR